MSNNRTGFNKRRFNYASIEQMRDIKNYGGVQTKFGLYPREKSCRKLNMSNNRTGFNKRRFNYASIEQMLFFDKLNK